MSNEVYVVMENGMPKVVYSDIRQMWAATSVDRQYVVVPFDPPIEKVYRVKVSFYGSNLRWEAERSEQEGHNFNQRYWGTGCLCWFVLAPSSEQAKEIAKGLFREMI